MRIALDRQSATARRLVSELSPHLEAELTAGHPRRRPDGTRRRRDDRRAAQRWSRSSTFASSSSRRATDDIGRRRPAPSLPLTGTLVRKNVWIVGGDGWAYDIGAGGLDHVLGSGHDVNVLVLDTEVYSNTGGQASKSTPRAAVAKFATARASATPKKDLGVEARRYGDVYIAQVAIGANDIQTVKAFAEAEAWPGPSLIIAYSTCIAHGIDMRTSMTHQRDAVRSGYWPLYRFHPGADEHTHPFQLDSKAPSIPLATFLDAEGRYAMLARTNPARRRSPPRAGASRRRRAVALLHPARRDRAQPCGRNRLPSDGAP